jgi:hypothetical protein
MGTATANIDKIKSLRAFADNLRGAETRWREKYSDRKHFDKQGFAFTYRTDTSWCAFVVPSVGFEAYVGTYGNSSCGRDWSVDKDLARHYFLNALNEHKQAIFDSMAEQADADAANLRDKAKAELDALNALLGEAA